MPSWKDYKGQAVGLARIMAEAPFSDGQSAQLIKNWVVDEQGYLDSTYSIMPFIPYVWNGGLPPKAFEEIALGDTKRSGVLAMKYVEFDGERPEILFLTNEGVFRYAPWSRPSVPQTNNLGNLGLEEQYYYTSSNTATTIAPQTFPRFPPQMEVYGNRVYFSFCDGGGLWVWDGRRIRPFGHTQRPSPPLAEGPERGVQTLDNNGDIEEIGANRGGFTHRGRVGTAESTFAVNDTSILLNAAFRVAGGVDTSTYQYAIVYENTDGAYSATSMDGSKVSIEMEVAGEDEPVERLLRRFRVHSIPKGPPETAARILLRTYNLHRLPTGSFGEYRFLHRIPNNEADEYIDDIPDGELGAAWKNRSSVPPGIYFIKSFGSSLWLIRNDAYPSRVWWSEQESAGSVPESFMENHFLDIFPSTGPITATYNVQMSDAEDPVMLVFKENSTHYVTGKYPNWIVGTLHHSAGCAGPELVQAMPDGGLIWYGGGTFWAFVSDGSIIDAGGAIRKRLRSVNQRRSKYGVSWVDREYREGVFVLPVNDSLTPNVQFIWDYVNQGWRIREDLKIDAALTLPEIEATLLAGVTKFSRKDASWSFSIQDEVGTVFVYHRTYPQFPVPTRESEYVSGWQSLSGVGPRMHSAHHATQLVVTAMERSSSTASVSVYGDWDLDNAVGSSVSLSGAHPEDDAVPFFGTTTYNSSSNFRSQRVYSEKLGIDIASQSVQAIKVSTSKPLALYNIDVWGVFLAGPGSRTPTNDP